VFLQQNDSWHALLPGLLAQYPRVGSLIIKVGAVHGIHTWLQKLR
jgi:hypothetical protein